MKQIRLYLMVVFIIFALGLVIAGWATARIHKVNAAIAAIELRDAECVESQTTNDFTEF